MGQIKNIKLHIVTDIKSNLVQSLRTENGPISILNQCWFWSSFSKGGIQPQRWKRVHSEISQGRCYNWSYDTPCSWFRWTTEHVEILHRRFSRYQSWSSSSSCHESALHRFCVHAAHLGKIHQILNEIDFQNYIFLLFGTSNISMGGIIFSG